MFAGHPIVLKWDTDERRFSEKNMSKMPFCISVHQRPKKYLAISLFVKVMAGAYKAFFRVPKNISARMVSQTINRNNMA